MKAVRGRNSKIRLTHKMENCKREHLLRYKTLFCMKTNAPIGAWKWNLRPLGNYDGPTDQPTDRSTDGQTRVTEKFHFVKEKTTS